MQWQKFIDSYDWKARLIPTAIILLPSFSTIFYFYPRIMSNPLQLAGSSFLAFALIYLASMFFRDLGVRFARKFWDERDGLPSTRFGRMRDSFLSHNQKNRIQVAVFNRFGIKLLSFEEEREFPALADRGSWMLFGRSRSSYVNAIDAAWLISTAQNMDLCAICAALG